MDADGRSGINEFGTILVTSIITTYNRPELAKRAIISVINQTYESLEIVVIEDGSESNLNAWCKQLEGREIIYVRHNKNCGLAAARNTGMKIASGSFIAYLDDDDEWLPDKIKSQITAIRKVAPEDLESIGMVTCGVELRYPKKNKIVMCPPGNRGLLKEDIIARGIIAPSSTFLFSKSALIQVGAFDENLPSSIDHDIIMSLAFNGYHAITVDECLAINYDRAGRATMMSNTETRITGVRMYVDKWLHVYQSWFGIENGIKYGQDYFTKVVAYLAINKLLSGDFNAASKSLTEIFAYNPRKLYVLKILFNYCIKLGASKFLPDKLNQIMKKIFAKIEYRP